jgi:hypothetical protein
LKHRTRKSSPCSTRHRNRTVAHRDAIPLDELCARNAKPRHQIVRCEVPSSGGGGDPLPTGRGSEGWLDAFIPCCGPHRAILYSRSVAPSQ